MTREALDTFLRQLGEELRGRGLADARVVAEAREHLVDAIDDGLRRGLSMEAAEQEAFARFGSPDSLAAHFERIQMASESNHGFAWALAIVWTRKWWILAPTFLAAAVTSVMASYFLPVRYRSEASIGIVRQGVPEDLERPSSVGGAADRLQRIVATVTSDARLERIIEDLNLYDAERQGIPMADVIHRMRGDIALTIVPRERIGDAVGGFTVGFVAPGPRTAQRVTERLAMLFIEENLREAVEGENADARAEGSVQLVSAQIEEARREIIRHEERLNQLRSQRARVTQTDRLKYDGLQHTYVNLLRKIEEMRRESGEQWKVAVPATLPEKPIGSSRLSVTVTGALAGLALGLVFLGASAKRRQ